MKNITEYHKLGSDKPIVINKYITIMAKVSQIKFQFKGTEHKVNVNCNSSGIFSAKLPEEIASALQIPMGELNAFSLFELEKDFESKLIQYKNSETTEELLILIAYQARGKYIERKDGGHLFFYDSEKYKIDISFSAISNAIGLDFEVAIKQTIDGKVRWFKTYQDEQGQYVKNRDLINSSLTKRCKIIPFNQDALNTLLNVQEKFRELSEKLFNFISKDEEEILLTLTSNKLLN